jgi:hypothetical protein
MSTLIEKFISFDNDGTNEQKVEYIKEDYAWSTLIELCLNISRVEHVEYEDEIYYSLHEDQVDSDVLSPEEKKLVCREYMNHCNLEQKNNIDRRKLKYIIGYYYAFDVVMDNYAHITDPNIQLSKEMLVYKGKIRLEYFKHRNDDHRGSDHTAIELPMEGSISLTDPTIADITDAIYRLKSCKFNKWYELLCECHVKDEGDCKVITMTTDYGS